MSAAKPILHVPRASRPCAAQRQCIFSLCEHGRDAHGTIFAIRNPQFAIRNAFSLVELLVVIGLIVLVMALALPAFNFISGSKSIDSATNVISAYLGRARAEAIAAGKPTGVLFYIDPVTDRRMMVMVQEAQDRTVTNPMQSLGIDLFLDLVADTEPFAMPIGIEIQFINDGTATNNANDRYIGFNNTMYLGAKPRTEVRYGSVILFDGAGRLVSKAFAFRCFADFRDSSNTLRSRKTRMGALMLDPKQEYNPDDSTQWLTPPNSPQAKDVIPGSINATTVLRSALGFVLVEQERFSNAPGTLVDSQIDQSSAGTYSGAESAEERWLDENATPLLINRYNGTLVKGQ